MANPNPSPSTRFGAEGGNPNNVGGKTAEQRKLDYEAAEMAAQIRHKALSVMLERIEREEVDVLDVVDPATLKLLKDSEDRAHGTPKATTEMSGPDGGAIPVTEVKFTVHDPKRNDD